MPKKYALELICDFTFAACRTYGGNFQKRNTKWWNKHSHKMKIHKRTKHYIEKNTNKLLQ